MIQKIIRRSFYTLGIFVLAAASIVGLLEQPAMAAPPYPDATNSGLTNASGLTPFTGQYDISTDNTVLENMDITGYLTIQGQNITIRNVRINTGQDVNIFYAVRVYSGSVTLENVEIIGGEAAAVTGTGFTIKNSYIHNFNGDAIVPANNASDITIQDNYIYDPDGFGAPFHRDGIQVQSGISNSIIKHNHIDIGLTGSLTAAIFVANDLGPNGAGPLLIEDNLLSGGSYSIGAYKAGNAGTIDNITVRYNRITESHVNSYCSMTEPSSDIQWYGNVKDIDGTLISQCNNMVSPDTTAPVVSVTSPTNGSTVSGTTGITATATDDSGLINKVEFYIDGVLLSTDTSSPYAASWNTTLAANGSHVITAKAYDPSNNFTTSSGVTVTVNNATPPPTDTDSDGVPDSVENAGPNGGDANGDGIADSQQAGVATYQNSQQSGYNTIEASGSCATLHSVAYSASSNAVLPQGETNGFGQVGFSMQCGAAGQSGNVKVLLDRVYTTSLLKIYKVSGSGVATDITNQVTFGVATVAGHQVTTISYTIIDGGTLDQDGVANSTIVDPVVVSTVNGGLANTGQSLTLGIIAGITVVIASMGGVLYIHRRYSAVRR